MATYTISTQHRSQRIHAYSLEDALRLFERMNPYFTADDLVAIEEIRWH